MAHFPICSLTDGSHVKEMGWAVRKAVDEGSIEEGRYIRYAELYKVLKQEDAAKYRKGSRKG